MIDDSLLPFRPQGCPIWTNNAWYSTGKKNSVIYSSENLVRAPAILPPTSWRRNRFAYVHSYSNLYICLAPKSVLLQLQWRPRISNKTPGKNLNTAKAISALECGREILFPSAVSWKSFVVVKLEAWKWPLSYDVRLLCATQKFQPFYLYSLIFFLNPPPTSASISPSRAAPATLQSTQPLCMIFCSARNLQSATKYHNKSNATFSPQLIKI